MERRAARRTQAKACATLILLACCPCAFALNPSLDVNQYAHNAWTIRDGFFKGAINAIAPSPDGYLWLGTEFGLLRFDGVRADPWMPPGGERLPSSDVLTLCLTRDGTLWIGTYAGLASWDGATLTRYPELDQQHVLSLLEDRDGTLWAGSFGVPSGRLCAIRRGAMQCDGRGGSLGWGVRSLFEDGAGNLWAAAGNGLWRWKLGPPKLYPTPRSTPPLEIRDLNRADDGQILIATNDGIREFSDGSLKPYPIPGVPSATHARSLFRDRDGGLWIGTTDRGIFHVHQGRTDAFSRSHGLSGDFIKSMLQDREDNIWIVTSGGLDRFREFAVSTISADQGLSTDGVWSAIAARDGSVWLGTRNGLNRWNNGKAAAFGKANGLPDDAPQSLFEDDAGRIWLFGNRGLGYLENGVFAPATGVPGGQVHAIDGDGAGGLWLSEDRNLLHVAAGRVVQRFPWSQFEAEQDAIVLLHGGEPGGLWLGFRLGRGVIYFKDGQIRRSYGAADGLGEGAVAGLKLDPDGALWAATAGGLSVIRNGHATTMTSKNGLPCDSVHWIMDDDNRSTWLYLACGLVRLDQADLDAWKADSKRSVHATLFDSSDGVVLHSNEGSEYSPRVSRSPDGRLWFVTEGGVSVIDPRHLPFNKLPPPVHIEQITADRKKYETSSIQRLPPLIRDLEIEYTALSLVAPEKIHFRYKLEGYDRDWKEVVNERKAFYTNLDPRSYRFRVMASNNSGVWNEAGASFDFSIAPAYYQTAWFQASCGAAFLVFLWGLHRYRLHQIALQFHTQLEARVGERTRIARDLHDTLLQSFHGLMLRFQVVSKLLPEGKAKEQLEKALERADEAIAEGRSAVYDLRSSATTTNELSEALNAVGNELSKEDTTEFGLVVEGPPKDLHPIIRDELYRISREALQNAFKHARARHIEAEINYGERVFRLRIRDDGEGIPAEILEQGRSGHYGLPGLRERAKQVGADLTIWSRAGTGTEIDLSLAGSIAYGKSPRRSRLRIFGKKGG